MEGGGAGRRGVPRGQFPGGGFAVEGGGAAPAGLEQSPCSTRAWGWSRPAGPTRRWVQERKERGRIGLGQDEERKLGRLVGFEKEKKKEREKEFGPKRERKKRKSLLNFDHFHLNSNLNLNSTEVRQIKQCIAIWMQDKKSNFIYFRKTTNYYLFFLY